MKKSTRIWLLFSALGLAVSLGVTTLFDSYPALRFISNEAVVFGVMFASMGTAVKVATTSS